MQRSDTIRHGARRLLLATACCLAAFGPVAHAASDGDGASASNGGGDTASARDELMQAYRKEYAFLVGQKRELQRRIDSFQQEARQDVAGTKASIDKLRDEVLSLESKADSLQERINEVEREREAAQQNADVLKATFQQAGATFTEYERDFMNAQAFTEQPQAQQLASVFGQARELLDGLTSIRREPGAFYAKDGSKVEGTLIHVGDIATYGVADEAAGLLAPAGGGELKVWQQPATDQTRQIAAGGAPETLPIFLYESLDKAVENEADQTVLATINSGGIIGWMIVGLGGFAVLLVLARIIFLGRASASTGRIVDEVRGHVAKHDIKTALEVCRKRKGSTSAVVAAALRNIHRNREQLEDIVNESILHESTRLERFGSIILVIAAVSPLLGLLGTVTGMISTFDVITQFGTGDPKLLSGGISTALVTTELGLIVAIPTLLVGNVLSGWADRIKDNMQKAALRVTNVYEEAALPRAA